MFWIIVFTFVFYQVCRSDFLGLNSPQKQLISDVWTTFKEYPEAGENILLEAIKMYPDAQKQFPTFANISVEKLKDDSTFRSQGNKTLAAVNRVISNLQNEEEIATFLKQIGQMHKRRKVPTQDFKTFHSAVVKVMKSYMGSRLSENAEDAVSKLIKAVIDRILHEYEGDIL